MVRRDAEEAGAGETVEPADLRRPLADPPASGRAFTSSRRIGLSDTTASGRLRFDALARYLQDVAVDDVFDADVEVPDHAWVVRRYTIDVFVPPVTDRTVTLTTWADGTGPSWATRRTRLVGDAGGLIEAESLWVFLNTATMRLERLPDRFYETYGTAIPNRVSGKLYLPASPPDGAEHIDWPLRITDFDIMEHMNNAAYWEAVETVIAMDDRPFGPCRAIMEFREGIELDARVTLAPTWSRAGVAVWFMVHGKSAAVATLRSLE